MPIAPIFLARDSIADKAIGAMILEASLLCPHPLPRCEPCADRTGPVLCHACRAAGGNEIIVHARSPRHMAQR